MSVKRMMMISLSLAILFTQEQLLVFLPNIQFTVLLLLVFASVYTLKENIILIISYVILDSMYMGGFNLFYMIPMLLAWLLIPTMYHVVLRKTDKELHLALFAFLFGFLYGWMFVPFNMLQTGISAKAYLIMDLPFEIIMGISGFVSVYWLYQPLYRVVQSLTNSPVITTTYKEA